MGRGLDDEGMADVEDAFGEEYKTTFAIGLENAQLLHLAAGWCGQMKE